MRNLRLFETLDEFIASQEAVSGSGEYVEDIYPGFAYIRELLETGKCVVYNGESKQGDYEFGDLIYYDGGDSLKKVYWSDFKENMGTPVGLIVVPSSMAPDGNARMIALRDIETSDVEGGSIDDPLRNVATKDPIEVLPTERELCEVPSSYPEGQYWYDGVAAMNIGELKDEEDDRGLKSAAKGSSDVEYYIDTDGGFLCSSDAVTTGGTGEVSSIENPVADGEYFMSNAGMAYGVSPYMTDSDEVNPNYLQEAWQGSGPEPGPKSAVFNYNAFSDFSGLTWSRMGANVQYSYNDAAQNYFKTVGTQYGDWYVPSLGEWGFIASRMRAIFAIFKALGLNTDESFFAPFEMDGDNSGGDELLSAINSPKNTKDGKGMPTPYATSSVFDGGTDYSTLFVVPYYYQTTTPKKDTGVLRSSYPSDIPDNLSDYTFLGVIGGANNSTTGVYVRPMAMIKGGKIITETGTLQPNGHQIEEEA